MTFDLRTFVELAVTSMEGASNVPYQATFAAMGIDKRTKKMFAKNKSGLSYGRMQHDVAAEVKEDKDNPKPTPKDKFEAILMKHPILKENKELRQKAIEFAATPGALPTPSNAHLLRLINEALGSEEGKILINTYDQEQITHLTNEIERVMKSVGLGSVNAGVFDRAALDPFAVAYAAAWANRSGDLGRFARYMAGEYVDWGGVRHHLPHPPTLQDVIDYIGTQKQFRPSWHPKKGNDENFESWQRRIITAVTGAATNLGLTLPPHLLKEQPKRTSALPEAINAIRPRQPESRGGASPSSSTAPESRPASPPVDSAPIAIDPVAPGAPGGGSASPAPSEPAPDPVGSRLIRPGQAGLMPGVSPTAFDNSGYEKAATPTPAPSHSMPTPSHSMPASPPPLAPPSFADTLKTLDADERYLGREAAFPMAPASALFESLSSSLPAPISARVAGDPASGRDQPNNHPATAPSSAPDTVAPRALERAPATTRSRTPEPETVLHQTRTAEKILKTAIATATTVLDRLHATHIRLADGAELPSTIVATSAAPQLSPSRSTRPTLADTMPSASHRPQREGGLDSAGMDEATAKQVRRLVREELGEWQSRMGADYRSTGLFRYRG